MNRGVMAHAPGKGESLRVGGASCLNCFAQRRPEEEVPGIRLNRYELIQMQWFELLAQPLGVNGLGAVSNIESLRTCHVEAPQVGCNVIVLCCPYHRQLDCTADPD